MARKKLFLIPEMKKCLFNLSIIVSCFLIFISAIKGSAILMFIFLLLGISLEALKPKENKR